MSRFPKAAEFVYNEQKMAVTYDESKIKTLSPLEHIRLRPGMYIGRLGNGTHEDDGIYILMKEIIDNSIDEFIMHYGSRIIITRKEHMVTVRDWGRGIPLGKVIDCVSMINTGAKYDNDVFQFSVGLNGVGLKAVNALSSMFTVTSFRDGEYFSATFSKGILKGQDSGKTDEQNGTMVTFTPDTEVFGKYEFNDDFIINRIKNYAYLNSGLSLEYNGQTFKSKNGLLDLLEEKVEDSNLYQIVYWRSSKVEFAFTSVPGDFGETYYSYVNGQHTSDGGTHQAAFKEGIVKGINDYFHESWDAQDVRNGMIGAIAVKVQSPVFESQTKNKLSNTEIRSDVVGAVHDGIIDFLLKHTDEAEKLRGKVENNAKLRKELAEVRKNAKEATKRVSLNIPKLRDCKFHLGQSKSHIDECENSMIFLTEGDSASGTITKTRDVKTQAVFSLRGKVKNVEGLKRTIIYKNEELFNIMKALGIEDGIEGLRYGKVVIATDADDDGYHIRILLMTYFLNFFEELVTSGRLYILETPLFRVRNKKEIRYCYSEAERDQAVGEVKDPEVTRFKGLGEIDPSEFGEFIGKDIKLIPVTVNGIKDLSKTMTFYMGDNTPERRDFIMQYLLPEEN